MRDRVTVFLLTLTERKISQITSRTFLFISGITPGLDVMLELVPGTVFRTK